MESIQFENLRAIKDSGEIKLSNLNLFLGANSTGKSTILRFFPLVRQTLFRNNDTPLLWYDPEGVDFGSFKESVHSKNEKEVLSYSFSFKDVDINLNNSNVLLDVLRFHVGEKKLMKSNNIYKYFAFFIDDNEKKQKNKISDISIKISINKDKYKKVSVKLDNKKIEFNFDESSIKIDGREILFFDDLTLEGINQTNKIIPEIFTDESKKNNSKNRHKHLQKIVDDHLGKKLFENINPSISIDKLAQFFSTLKYYGTRKEFEAYILEKKFPKTILATFKKNIDYIYDDYTILTALFTMNKINENLDTLFSQISYIAPVRATAERYYRIQGLSVLDVDSTGTNVPMILHSMSAKQKSSWKKWTKETFNIEFETFQNGGHIGINVHSLEENKYNLADTGFGYSQILPVLLVIWKQINNKGKYKSRRGMPKDYYGKMESPKNLIVIEQPELHLHPAMQAQFADLLISIISNYPEIQFIIETHSIVIMNRIGQHIEKNNLEENSKNLEDKINIFLVNPISNNDTDKNITPTSYDHEGIIKEWPVGFLSGGIL
ncbi:AAA family ATPase [Lactococcus sp. S64]|uniref:AAA family ATPase n=1 Tax=Lactococcus sp. S64 TaxID=2767459 RepID=UPI001907E3E7|nr:AAA family ATPase [Lactococcus sp. S64]MBK0084402.1 AAA family ATPase [Lactococcus sp. S64]